MIISTPDRSSIRYGVRILPTNNDQTIPSAELKAESFDLEGSRLGAGLGWLASAFATNNNVHITKSLGNTYLENQN
ncbi:hypothetical protein JTB14_035922 [Gonioctena quinquepunctata]|nr:hypothetical protein JTB14_035922 [Gonioctena quinquepunctata]